MTFQKKYFGTLSNGLSVSLFVVKNKKMTMSVTNYGCSITRLLVSNENGSKTDVVLGFSTLNGYVENWGSFGAIIGRYSNKISGSKFVLNGVEYNLFANCDNDCLHGGFPRWESMLWNGKFIRKDRNTIGVKFSKRFPDGFQGFPGNLLVEVEYLIDDGNQITMSYKAISDKETPISITNHSYFNLRGYGDIKENKLKLYSNKYLETDDNNIPTGNFIDVKGTKYDFLDFKKIGEDFPSEKNGYDDCFVTNVYSNKSGIPTKDTTLVKVAELIDNKVGKKMTVFSNCEGVQLYTANYVKYVPGKYGAFYMPHNAVCLETQNFPDSVNRPEFPSVILKTNQEYYSVTKYKFESIKSSLS